MAANVQAPAARYLDLVSKRLAAIRKDLPKLIKMGEKMAELMLAGAEIYTPSVNPFWPNEFGGRAGGFMGIRSGDEWNAGAKNVAYFALPDARKWNPSKDEKLKKLLDGKSHLFVNGREEDLKAVGTKRFAGFTGGPDPDQGMYGVGQHRPLAGTWEFEFFVRGWIVAGELFAACTRAGRTPMLWMSVWLEGALPRNAHFFNHDNLREPWYTPFFHSRQYVPPIKAGAIAEEFLWETQKIHARLVEQTELLGQAGSQLAKAKQSGKRIWTVAVGHSYPEILDLPKPSDYPIEWGPSYSDLTKAIPDDLGKDDVALHFGYAPVNNDDVKKLLARGLKLIYTSPYGNHMKPVKHQNFLYFDLPWRPADATVDIPGYSVRLLPMSSTAQTMALFAILSEMAEKMGWK